MVKKTDMVWEQFYGPHLGFKQSRNPATSRLALIERMYMRVLTELAVNRYKWKGLPESINPRYLEMTLAQNALAVFYFDSDYNEYFALRGSPAGEPNMQDDPIRFQVLGNRFVNKWLSAMPSLVRLRDERGRFTSEVDIVPEECIPIWANYLRIPDWDIITIYASRLAEIDRTIEINSKNARRPKVVAVDQNMRLSTTNINRQIDEGQSFIEVNSTQFDNVVPLTALDLGINPDTIEKLQISRTRMWNECMGLLGINNANQDKKERLVSDEVDANNEQVESMRWVNLNARRQACHMINRRYGLALSVDFHTVQSATMPEQMSSEPMGEDEFTDE